jgi:hypothetical protein
MNDTLTDVNNLLFTLVNPSIVITGGFIDIVPRKLFTWNSPYRIINLDQISAENTGSITVGVFVFLSTIMTVRFPQQQGIV